MKVLRVMRRRRKENRRRHHYIKTAPTVSKGILYLKIYPELVHSSEIISIMQQYTTSVFVLGVVAVLLSSTMTTASVISCPPNSLQESNPDLQQLCFAIKEVLSEAAQQDQFNRMGERNVNPKRQDVDHVFLRFGRRFGL